jgi:hypothetical protein
MESVNGERDPVPAGDDVLARALEVQRWRTAVAVEISPRLWDYFDEVAPILAMVEDLVDRWITSMPGRVPLIGPDGFATAYLAAVEKDPGGRPWWQFCRLGADRRPVLDDSYPKRVWTYHAGWLQRIALTGVGDTAVPEPLPDGLAGHVVVERLRTEAAVDVAAAVDEWLGNDRDQIAAVVADVVAGWLDLPADQRAGLTLTGVGQFAQRYVARVLYADPAEDEYWAEFCPPPGQAMDWDAYARAVWTSHVTELAGAR